MKVALHRPCPSCGDKLSYFTNIRLRIITEVCETCKHTAFFDADS
jgi:hypothetical protein